ncbi:hypothetical protein [Kaarinaea lacus]
METVIKQPGLSTTSRVFRIVAGTILIGITMSATSQLGYLALLPLLAIYPIVTGIVGEDPLDVLFASWKGGFEGVRFSPSSRVALLGLGGVAIGAMMLSPESVGIRATLALASVYPIMAGLFGEDLLYIALGFETKGLYSRTSEAEPQQQAVTLVHSAPATSTGQKAGAIRDHRFGHGVGPKAA